MTTLFQLQKYLFTALTSDSQLVPGIIHSIAPLSAQQRVAIYKDSITTALLNTLRDTYEVCRKLTGDDFFHAMTKIYIQQTPSLSPDIGEYGSSLPAFIRGFSHAASLPYLADVAALEWAWHQALRGTNHRGLAIHTLAQIPPTDYSQIIFKLPPDSTLLASAYPVTHIWSFNQDDYQGSPSVDLDAGGVRVLVWRQDMDIRMDVLTTPEWQLLTMIQAEATVGELVEQFVGELDVTQLLGGCVEKGWIGSWE